MEYAVIIIALVLSLLAAALTWLAQQRQDEGESLVDAIDRCLPQTQCGQCGYPGCRPYAQAIANQKAAINLCPPGGERSIAQLAKLLGTRKPTPAQPPEPHQLAMINETDCIGCTLCQPACPVDAIVGAQKQMHTIIHEHCTGCGLCLPACPVDCISLVRPS